MKKNKYYLDLNDEDNRSYFFISFDGELVNLPNNEIYKRLPDGRWHYKKGGSDISFQMLGSNLEEAVEKAFQQYRRDLVDLILEEPVSEQQQE